MSILFYKQFWPPAAPAALFRESVFRRHPATFRFGTGFGIMEAEKGINFMKKLYVFDLDGTLIDSIADITAALNSALADFALPRITEAQCLGMIGHGPTVLVQRATPNCYDAMRAQILRLYHNRYSQHLIAKTAVFPGVFEMLRALSADGAALAVLSNKSKIHTEKIVRALFPNDLLWRVIGQSDEFETKPSPNALLYLIMQADLDPQQVVYIGDSPVDIETAVNAGVDGVCVGWGYSSRQALTEAGAAAIAETPQQLFEMLRAME